MYVQASAKDCRAVCWRFSTPSHQMREESMATVIGFFALFAVLLLVMYFAKPAPRSAHGIHGRPILSVPELAFYKQLCRSLPEYSIFPQVAVNAILEVDKKLPRGKRASLRNRYSQWHVDFVVCEPDSLKIIGIIEFDGKQHNAAADAWRDKLLAEGGYVVHRFRAKDKLSDAEITARLSQPLPPAPSEQQQF